MFINELITLLVAAGVFLFVLYCLKRGAAWLYASVAVNLVCIAVFGAIIIPLFGGQTNAGNIFYVGVFFAGQLFAEHYGKRRARDSIFIGLAAILFFLIMARLTLMLLPSTDSLPIVVTLKQIFAVAPRIAFASIASYLLSQTINVYAYAWLREKGPIWFRSLMATGAGQFVDSVFFFIIAFAGVLSTPAIINAASTGFVIKTVAGALTIPLIYYSYRLEGKKAPVFVSETASQN